MKKILIAFFILTGCYTEKYYQSFEASPKQELKTENGCYVFENDSVKVIYDFFAENGKMWFMVFNKKSVPLYIDWNKSSLIVNSAKVPYWKDNTITKSRFKSDTRYYEVYPNYPLSSYAEYFLKRQYGLSESVTVRPERITVIPPQAQWFKVEYNLCIMDIYPTAPYKKVTLERTRQTDGKDKQVNGDSYSVEFSADKSPLLFSNFLTLSYSENFSNEFYITNQFYVSRIIEMDKRFYKGILVNQKFNYPYITSTSFSKLIPYNLTMEYNAIHCDYVSHSGRRCTFSKVKGSNFCKTHSK